MAQCVKISVVKPENLSLMPRMALAEKRSDPHQLSPDIHFCTLEYVCTHISNIFSMLLKVFIIKNLQDEDPEIEVEL